MDTDKNKNVKDAKGLIYGGFTILGGTVGGIYGFTANRFQLIEIFALIGAGFMVGVALALICNGIIASFRK